MVNISRLFGVKVLAISLGMILVFSISKSIDVTSSNGFIVPIPITLLLGNGKLRRY